MKPVKLRYSEISIIDLFKFNLGSFKLGKDYSISNITLEKHLIITGIL